MRVVISVAFFCLLTISLFTQESGNFPPPKETPTIFAHKVEGIIKVDGKLSELEWQNASPITDFFRMEPRQGGAYRHQTEVRLLYDEKNLYVGAFCRDSLGQKGIRVQDLRRDFQYYENDIFYVQLDPQNLKQYCVSFQTTPYGNQGDLQAFNDTNRDSDWNALWKVRTHRTDTGYYAEFAIPFKSLRYEVPAEGNAAVWGITFSRLARRDYEQTVFPAIPQSFSPYRMTYAAQLKGIELPEPSSNVRIEPYSLYQYENLALGNDKTTDGDIKLGGDVKWAINPRSVLDLTFNTDFAQADVDRAVNNLERFNIFFPERRQFFLENSGIWAGSDNRAIVPFLSRRIGLQGSFNSKPARLNAGTRYTMRDENRSIAGLYIHQAETPNSPAASFGVARYLHNYGKENNVGVMLTHRLDEASSELGMTQSNNTTLTIDGLIRPKDELTISYMLSGARDNSNDTVGLAGRFSAVYSANDLYMFWRTSFVSENYNPDMGFVFQNNVIWHNPGGFYIWRPKNIPWIRRYDPGVYFNYYHDANQPGNFQQASLYIFPVYIYFGDNSFLEYSLLPTWQNINFDFSPLGLRIQQDRYFYLRQYIRFRTDASKPLSLTGRLDWGSFYDGTRRTVTTSVRFAPLPHLAFTAEYEYNDLQNIGIENQDLQTHLVTGGIRVAASPRLQLSAFYQYNSFDEQGRWNVRASWEYRPLSFLYLVFNDTQVNSLDRNLSEQQVISKLTLMQQF